MELMGNGTEEVEMGLDDGCNERSEIGAGVEVEAGAEVAVATSTAANREFMALSSGIVDVAEKGYSRWERRASWIVIC